jgi:uncharacterized damage-inducible protein DinB
MPMLTPPIVDERDGLTRFLAQARNSLKVAAYGLTDEQAGLTPTPSSLSVGGLIKHVTLGERNWMATVRGEQRMRDPELYLASFRFESTDSVADLIAEYDAAARETDEQLVSIPDLGRRVEVPQAPWLPDDIDSWSVRWVLHHLITETTRHAGHADLIREAIDGATAGTLLAAVENWPETEFVKPWARAS